MLSHVEANELLDVYGDLLTQRKKEILELYFQEDLSYTEISEELSISRAAAQDSVQKSIKQLQKYESVIQYISKKKQVLSLVEKDNKLQSQIEEIL